MSSRDGGQGLSREALGQSLDPRSHPVGGQECGDEGRKEGTHPCLHHIKVGITGTVAVLRPYKVGDGGQELINPDGRVAMPVESGAGGDRCLGYPLRVCQSEGKANRSIHLTPSPIISIWAVAPNLLDFPTNLQAQLHGFPLATFEFRRHLNLTESSHAAPSCCLTLPTAAEAPGPGVLALQRLVPRARNQVCPRASPSRHPKADQSLNYGIMT